MNDAIGGGDFVRPSSPQSSQKSGQRKTERFAPMPARAIGDQRLSAVDLRVLMAIAAHDQFQRNGAGCYASHKRLSELVGCHGKSVSRSISILAKAGYLTARTNPLNNKTRIYNVVYRQFDDDYMAQGKGNRPVTDDGHIGNDLATDHWDQLSSNPPSIGNQSATQSDDIGNELVPENGPIGNKDFSNNELNQIVAEGKISCETIIYPEESEKRYSAEAGAFEKKTQTARNAAPMLGLIERSLQSSSNHHEIPRWIRWIDEQIDQGFISPKSEEYPRAILLIEIMKRAKNAA